MRIDLENCEDLQNASICQRWKDVGLCEDSIAIFACQRTCGVCGK